MAMVLADVTDISVECPKKFIIHTDLANMKWPKKFIIHMEHKSPKHLKGQKRGEQKACYVV